jgi:hypothetical protein
MHENCESNPNADHPLFLRNVPAYKMWGDGGQSVNLALFASTSIILLKKPN